MIMVGLLERDAALPVEAAPPAAARRWSRVYALGRVFRMLAKFAYDLLTNPF
jgi:hypothetical protein